MIPFNNLKISNQCEKTSMIVDLPPKIKKKNLESLSILKSHIIVSSSKRNLYNYKSCNPKFYGIYILIILLFYKKAIYYYRW